MPTEVKSLGAFAKKRPDKFKRHLREAVERDNGKKSVAAIIAAKRKLNPFRVLCGLTITEAISRAFLGFPEVF